MKELNILCAHVRHHLKRLDALMKQPSTYERGSEIAKSSNRLEIALDMFERYHKQNYAKVRKPFGKSK